MNIMRGIPEFFSYVALKTIVYTVSTEPFKLGIGNQLNIFKKGQSGDH